VTADPVKRGAESRVGRSRDAGGGANWVAHQAILCRARLSRTMCRTTARADRSRSPCSPCRATSNAGGVSKIAWGERTTVLH
jgi:hypothetical protein